MCEVSEGMEYIAASINGNIVNNVRFAENIYLIARQLGDLQQLLIQVEEVSTRYTLEISETKIEWLVMKHGDSIDNSQEQQTLNGKPLKKVCQFCYLSATLASNDDCTTDITIRTATA